MEAFTFQGRVLSVKGSVLSIKNTIIVTGDVKIWLKTILNLSSHKGRLHCPLQNLRVTRHIKNGLYLAIRAHSWLC